MNILIRIVFIISLFVSMLSSFSLLSTKPIPKIGGKIIEPPYGYFKMCKNLILNGKEDFVCRRENICKNLELSGDIFVENNKAKIGNVEYISFYNTYCSKNKEYKLITQKYPRYSKSSDNLQTVFTKCKSNFKYISEEKLYPRLSKKIVDIWKLTYTKNNKLLGDCDEFQLQMIYELYSKNPNLNLYMSVGFAPNGEGHAIPLFYNSKTGILWQFDIYLENPVPAYWGFHSFGYKVGQYSNGIFNLKEGVWREFNISAISPISY